MLKSHFMIRIVSIFAIEIIYCMNFNQKQNYLIYIIEILFILLNITVVQSVGYGYQVKFLLSYILNQSTCH